MLESRTLSSACLVSCWRVVFGSRHSCLEFWSRDGVRTLALHFLSLCECVVSSSLGTAHSCPRVFCCVARSSCFYRLRAFMLYLVLCGTQLVYSLAACFHVVMSCVNTWLMSFLISCLFMSCFAHGWWFVCWPCACVSVLCEYVASVLVFCVSGALMSICLDPTHLVTRLLINFPQLLSLITLIICSLYNLVFAVPCGFVTICWVVYVLCPVQSSPVQSSPVQSSPVQSSPVQSSPVQSSPVQSSQLFPYGVVFVCLFVCFVLFIVVIKSTRFTSCIWVLASSIPSTLTENRCTT